MSYQENRIIAYLISALLGTGYYSFHVIQEYNAGSFDSTTISSEWGVVILAVVTAQVVLSIILAILVSIVKGIVAREETGSLSDERDRLITLKADRISYAVFGIGFLLAMISLAAGQSPLVMFNVIVFSLFGAGMAGFATQIYLYRRGF